MGLKCALANVIVLAPDDNTLFNKTLAYNLISDGYEVVSAYTCFEAKGLMKNNYYNLVLLDINLPDENGLSLCAEIKERSPETYIKSDDSGLSNKSQHWTANR